MILPDGHTMTLDDSDRPHVGKDGAPWTLRVVDADGETAYIGFGHTADEALKNWLGGRLSTSVIPQALLH